MTFSNGILIDFSDEPTTTDKLDDKYAKKSDITNL